MFVFKFKWMMDTLTFLQHQKINYRFCVRETYGANLGESGLLLEPLYPKTKARRARGVLEMAQGQITQARVKT